MGKKNKVEKTIELEEINVILKIPRDAASVTITAIMIDEDEKTQKVERKLTAENIRIARQDFLDNVELGDDYDTRFVLTDEGKAYLEALQKLEGIGGDA